MTSPERTRVQPGRRHAVTSRTRDAGSPGVTAARMIGAAVPASDTARRSATSPPDHGKVGAQMASPDSRSVNDDRRHETPLERLDRNLEEMTGELRVVVTGVQVLFAFLLIVPFNTGFAHVGGFERAVYFVTLVLAALAAACTIAPSAGHRFLFRHDDKRYLVFRSNHVVIAGLAFLALAMCGCLLLVATKLFGPTAGSCTAGAALIVFLGFWFVVPLARLRAVEKARGGESGHVPTRPNASVQEPTARQRLARPTDETRRGRSPSSD